MIQMAVNTPAYTNAVTATLRVARQASAPQNAAVSTQCTRVSQRPLVLVHSKPNTRCTAS